MSKPWCEQNTIERLIGLLRSARSELVPVKGETARLCEQIDETLRGVFEPSPVAERFCNHCDQHIFKHTVPLGPALCPPRENKREDSSHG